jgi:hypothetical protein
VVESTAEEIEAFRQKHPVRMLLADHFLDFLQHAAGLGAVAA